MAIKTVGIIGCGLMGSGIAQVSAQSGHTTIVREVNQEFLDKGMDRIKGFLEKGVEKGKMKAEDKDATLGRLSGTTELKDLADCDLIIEAIIENVDEKQKLYSELDKICKPGTIFASNTSSLSITEMSAATKRLDKFGGLHFFNPVPIMKLVEVVSTIHTSDDTAAALTAFAEAVGKKPIQAPDRPGFIVNRLLVPYILDAIRALEEGVGTKEDIDLGLKLGCGYPMGPFELLDFVGLDTTYYIANIMYDEFKEKRYAPPVLLTRMVKSGLYGRKNGRGFYDYKKK